MSWRAKIKDRKRVLGEIIRELEDLKKRGFENQYAIDENIKFFEAINLPRVTLGHRVTLGFATMQ